jgi:hypothetical protein
MTIPTYKLFGISTIPNMGVYELTHEITSPKSDLVYILDIKKNIMITDLILVELYNESYKVQVIKGSMDKFSTYLNDRFNHWERVDDLVDLSACVSNFITNIIKNS